MDIEINEEELLKYAEQEELFLFANADDYLAIANGVIELVNIKLRDKVASAEAFNLEQILHDPENQPSQYGTVPLEWYENLENKINRIRFNVEQVIDSLSGSYDMHAIRKKLQNSVDDEALSTQASESEINSLKQRVNVLEKALANQSIEIANDILTIESYSHKVTALQADNLRLREALEDLAEFSNNRERINKLLSSTPTQSLAEHDNEVKHDV